MDAKGMSFFLSSHKYSLNVCQAPCRGRTDRWSGVTPVLEGLNAHKRNCLTAGTEVKNTESLGSASILLHLSFSGLSFLHLENEEDGLDDF